MKLFAASSLVSLSLLLALPGHGEEAPAKVPCPEMVKVLDNTQIQIVRGSNTCYFDVSPRNDEGLYYRSFLMDLSGLFMAFDSYGNGPDSVATGAHEFYFFPRLKDHFDYQYDAATKRLDVSMPSGKVATFNTEKGILLSISGTKLSLDYEVFPGNEAGTKVIGNDGVFLDVGYQLGQSPSQDPKRSINFKDKNMKSCTVKNADVTANVGGDSVFKFDDIGLKKFLTKTCKNLSL